MNKIKPLKPVILTGDRPTGPLHLGHLVGSLSNRVAMQEDHEQFILIADNQGLTDNIDKIENVQNNILEVTLDYLAVGIDPMKTTICLQSHLPALSDLTMFYLNFITVSRLERNPTIKDEILSRGFGRDIPAGFLCYPAAQAADITAFEATVVPVGDDQAPLIEQTNEIVRKINAACSKQVLREAKALIPKRGRLPGLDGTKKMSKSEGNSLALGATEDEITKAVRSMFTDPNHVRVEDPGRIEGNMVFTYLDFFGNDLIEVQTLKDRYRHGGLGDAHVKGYLEDILQDLIRPIRERRKQFASDPAQIYSIIKEGTEIAKEVTNATWNNIRDEMNFLNLTR